MDTINSALGGFFTAERTAGAVRAALLILGGYFVARLVAAGVGRLAARHASPQSGLLARRLTFYLVFGLVAVSALRELGFDLSILLGAAGVLTVAVGFASQTSASNLISGAFLLIERPFVVGDVVEIEGRTGEVIAIDLLSTKMRTFDNLYIRVPNETVMKAVTTNLIHFPIRRFDLKIGLAYKEDIERARGVLFEVADQNPLCLDEPAPLVIFQGFGDSSVDLQFSVWATRENFLKMRNRLAEEVKAALDAHGIEIPFPHRTLYAGSATEPLPIRLVSGERESP